MTLALNWSTPSKDLHLGSNEVQVWLAELDQPYDMMGLLESTLSPDELIRANRFRFEKDRNHFIAARGILRDILGGYLDLPPRTVRFEQNSYGKPLLLDSENSRNLNFNVSHSGNYALFAVILNRRVGIDIEQIRHDFGGEEIARRFFSPREVDSLLSLSQAQQIQAFFSCWTRKEAFIKAKGKGLSIPLDQFDVELRPSQPVRLLQTQWDADEASCWSLKSLSVAENYAAAIAVEGHDWRLKNWRWHKPVTTFTRDITL